MKLCRLKEMNHSDGFVFSISSGLAQTQSFRLKHIEIPNTVVSIGKEALINYGSLKRIIIPHGVEKNGESAFLGCPKLEKVIIPESIKKIGQNAFKGCKMVPEGMRDEKA